MGLRIVRTLLGMSGRQRFVCSSSLLFFSLFLLLLSLSSRRSSTGGLGRGRTEPTRAAIETRDKTRGQQVRAILFFVVHSICVFSSFFFFFIVYSATTDRAGTKSDRTNAVGDRNAGRNSESTGACRVYDLFSTQFIISSSHSSSFPLCAVQQQAGLGGTQRDRRGRRSNTGPGQGGRRAERGGRRVGCMSKEGGGQRQGAGRVRD